MRRSPRGTHLMRKVRSSVMNGISTGHRARGERWKLSLFRHIV